MLITTTFLRRIAGRNDLLVAVLLTGIIFMMVLPLPRFAVDGLIALNLALTVLLLMMAVYLSRVTQLSAFPAILLLTTLFRLALSVSTTRLILLHGDGGSIISTFGRFVVGGNLIVGLVVFLILTIVNFLVITKGSERAAEVSARFSLDSMPGKQMAIDSDMRAGMVDLAEARDRRSRLEQESQLYAAMDGAMKFVKGDAIAGMIIIVVNLFGGMGVGTFQRGMAAADALNHYSLLAVGDGLVAQIPALLISMTAGFIVTRVASDKESDLGTVMVAQLFGKPESLLITGFILALCAALPGFPAPIFLTLSALTAAAGWRQKWNKNKGAASSAVPVGPDIASTGTLITFAEPVSLELSPAIIPSIAHGRLDQALARTRETLTLDLGLPFPAIHIATNPALAEDTYRLLLHEAPVSIGEIAAIGDMETELAEQASRMMRRHASGFLGIQETMNLLSALQETHPDLVKEVARTLSITTITSILQRLLREDVSIRNMRNILETLVTAGQREKDAAILTEHVRENLGQAITSRHTARDGSLTIFLLSGEMEEAMRDMVRQLDLGAPPVPAVQRSRIVAAVRDRIAGEALATQPVLVTAPDIRRMTRSLIEAEMAAIPVLTLSEIPETIKIHVIDRIKLTNE